jgi:hypothetical protein
VRERILIRGKTMREPRPSDAPDKRDEESSPGFAVKSAAIPRTAEAQLPSAVTTLVSRKVKSNQTDDNRRHTEKIAWRDASMQRDCVFVLQRNTNRIERIEVDGH